MEELLSKKKGAGSVWFNLQVGYSQSIKEIKIYVSKFIYSQLLIIPLFQPLPYPLSICQYDSHNIFSRLLNSELTIAHNFTEFAAYCISSPLPSLQLCTIAVSLTLLRVDVCRMLSIIATTLHILFSLTRLTGTRAH